MNQHYHYSKVDLNVAGGKSCCYYASDEEHLKTERRQNAQWGILIRVVSWLGYGTFYLSFLLLARQSYYSRNDLDYLGLDNYE